MTKALYHVPVAIAICFALAATATLEAKGLKTKNAPTPKREATDTKDKVTLEIAGPSDSQAVAAYQKALASSGLTAKIHENKKGDKPLKVMAQVDKATDLGPFGKAVMTAIPTKPGQMPPGLELMIYAPLTKENSSQAMAQLEK